jgi:hypothetical protein
LESSADWRKKSNDSLLQGRICRLLFGNLPIGRIGWPMHIPPFSRKPNRRY